MVERLAFLRRLKLLRNVPIEELAAFSHVVGTAVLSNRYAQNSKHCRRCVRVCHPMVSDVYVCVTLTRQNARIPCCIFPLLASVHS